MHHVRAIFPFGVTHWAMYLLCEQLVFLEAEAAQVVLNVWE